jgi:hypothetical protein
MTFGGSKTIARYPDVQGAAPAAFPRGQSAAADAGTNRNHGTQVTSAD